MAGIALALPTLVLPADCLAAEHARFSWARLGSAAGDRAGSYPAPTVVVGPARRPR